MLFNATINLISISEGKNQYGEITETSIKRTIFANVKSVRQSEFYAAQTAGKKPEIVLVVRAAEYAGEEKIEYNGEEYYFIRCFSKNGELLELVCGKGVR